MSETPDQEAQQQADDQAAQPAEQAAGATPVSGGGTTDEGQAADVSTASAGTDGDPAPTEEPLSDVDRGAAEPGSPSEGGGETQENQADTGSPDA